MEKQIQETNDESEKKKMEVSSSITSSDLASLESCDEFSGLEDPSQVLSLSLLKSSNSGFRDF